MSKRTARYQLTAENYDDEEDEESKEAKVGEFSKASSDVMSKRIIKKAKRRGDGGEVKSSNPFGGLGGFGPLQSSFGKASFPSTGFGSDKTVASIKPTFGVSSFGAPSFGTDAKTTGTDQLFKFTDKSDHKVMPEFGLAKGETSAARGDESKVDPDEQPTNGVSKVTDVKEEITDAEQQNQEQYAEQITSLNISFLGWIKQHIDKDPLIDLTPVFKDYTKHMEEIERTYGKTTNTDTTTSKVAFADTDTASKSQPTSVEKTSTANAFSLATASVPSVFSSSTATTSAPSVFAPPSATTGVSNVFSLATTAVSNISPATGSAEPKTSVLSATPLFGNKAESKTADVSFKPPVAGFFSAAQTSTPSTSSAVSNDDKEVTKDTEDNEVKKPERKTIVEEDAFYTSRCKLFFKNDQEWKELGIGMLYLKSPSNKTQLLIRMETAGGKILLNISLHDKLPANRVGKNNVSIVSVPNPPVFLKEKDGDNSKPVTYLIRVKDKHEADSLLKEIEENKSKA